MPSHQSPPASAACVSGYEDQGRRLGKHWSVISPTQTPWIPALAGMTETADLTGSCVLECAF